MRFRSALVCGLCLSGMLLMDGREIRSLSGELVFRGWMSWRDRSCKKRCIFTPKDCSYEFAKRISRFATMSDGEVEYDKSNAADPVPDTVCNLLRQYRHYHHRDPRLLAPKLRPRQSFTRGRIASPTQEVVCNSAHVDMRGIWQLLQDGRERHAMCVQGC